MNGRHWQWSESKEDCESPMSVGLVQMQDKPETDDERGESHEGEEDGLKKGFFIHHLDP